MMRRFLAAVLYTAFALGANPALADVASASALRDGDMKKLTFAETPKDLPEIALTDLDENPVALTDTAGQWRVVNFWATWCPPCRKEMPSLDALQAEMGSESFAVITIATGRNPLPGIEKFMTEAGIKNLPILRDPRSDLAHVIGIVGLPVTLILNPQGQEVARLIGDADWNSPNAKAVLAALISDAP